ERTLAERNRQLAAQLGTAFRNEGPAAFLKLSEPIRNALEPRPPECPRLWKILQDRKVLAPQLQQLTNNVVGQSLAIAFGELADRSVDHDAAVARARRRIDRVERPQTEQMPRVDAVGIAQPVLD